MKKLIAELQQKGVRVQSVNYRAHGRVVARGYDFIFGSKCIEVEPKNKGVKHVIGTNSDLVGDWFTQHYSPNRNGFTPALCRHISLLRSDIFEYFSI